MNRSEARGRPAVADLIRWGPTISGDHAPPRWLVHRRRWLTVLVAMAAATLVAGIAGPLLDVDLVVRLDGSTRQVSNLAVTLTSLVAGLAGWATLAILERWTRHARRLWTAIACLVFVVSLAGPLAAVDTAATIVLLTLHSLVAAIVIWGLRRSGPTAGRGDPSAEGVRR